MIALKFTSGIHDKLKVKSYLSIPSDVCIEYKKFFINIYLEELLSRGAIVAYIVKKVSFAIEDNIAYSTIDFLSTLANLSFHLVTFKY